MQNEPSRCGLFSGGGSFFIFFYFLFFHFLFFYFFIFFLFFYFFIFYFFIFLFYFFIFYFFIFHFFIFLFFYFFDDVITHPPFPLFSGLPPPSPPCFFSALPCQRFSDPFRRFPKIFPKMTSSSENWVASSP